MARPEAAQFCRTQLRPSLWAVSAALVVGCAAKEEIPTQPAAIAPARQPLDVALLDASGSPTSLEALRTDTTVIAMWASYCGTCKKELPAMQRLAERYRDDPNVSVVVLSTDPQSEHARARAMLAETAPGLESFFVARERDMHPLAPQRPDGTRVITLPMTLVIDAKDTWHYSYGGGTTADEFVAQHDALIQASREGALAAAVEPPAKSVAIRYESSGEGRYSFTVTRGPNDNEEIAKQLLGMLEVFLGYSQARLDDARPLIEQGLQRGETTFIFEGG